jgi:hypothetical protein
VDGGSFVEKLGFANLTLKLLCSDDGFNGNSCIHNILLNNKLMHYLYDWNLIVLYIDFAGWNFDTLLFVWSNDGFSIVTVYTWEFKIKTLHSTIFIFCLDKELVTIYSEGIDIY